MTRGEQGFSLIEALVALAILAISAVGLIRAAEAHVDSVRGLERRAAAQWVAENRLAELAVPGAATADGDVAMLGRAWQVTTTYAPTADPALRRGACRGGRPRRGLADRGAGRIRRYGRRELTRRQAALAADLFTAVVIASVAIALAALTWRIFAGVPSGAPAVPVVAVPRGDVDVAPILAMAPFGSGGGGEAVATTLPIELRGLVSSQTPRASTALIAPTGGAAISYAIGQPVPGGAIVESIGMDHVILTVAGHREILGFPKPPVAEGAAATPPSGPPQPVTVPGASAPPSPPNGGFAPSPQSILEGLGATPMPNGYRIGDGISPAYRQSGLQPGDVIEQVNGTKLGNPAMDQQLLASAVRAGNVRIDILRGDRRMTLSFPVR